MNQTSKLGSFFLAIYNIDTYEYIDLNIRVEEVTWNGFLKGGTKFDKINIPISLQ